MFERIGIIGFVENTRVAETLVRLAQFLDQSGLDFLVEEGTGALTKLDLGSRACDRAKLGDCCDLIIVVGGDGSMLHAARDLIGSGKPLLGVNRGRLGFLTDIPPSELEPQVGEVLRGNFVTSKRFLLHCELWRGSKMIGQGIALNDVVLQPHTSIRMIEFSLEIDGQYVYTQRSDGLIVATPTGSTAYALSGGGPIVHPSIEAIDIVPINPHTLSNRPIVVDANSQLTIDISPSNQVEVQVVCDGQDSMISQTGDQVRIRKHDRCVELIHPKAHDFYQTCRTKLNWARE